jgi:hypothetical protein
MAHRIWFADLLPAVSGLAWIFRRLFWRPVRNSCGRRKIS